jgi:hypothetical protein
LLVLELLLELGVGLASPFVSFGSPVAMISAETSAELLEVEDSLLNFEVLSEFLMFCFVAFGSFLSPEDDPSITGVPVNVVLVEAMETFVVVG